MSLDNLKKAAKNNRLAGAYLFVGAEGIGKSSVALELASSLGCTPLDIHVIEPEGAGDVIKIERVRGLQEKLSLKPYEAKHKFAIIKEAQAMKEEAANAFLKLLEEPPPDTTIILITSNMEKILPTIISRCQIVRFHGKGKCGESGGQKFIDSFLKALDDETVELGIERSPRKDQEEAVEALLGLYRDALAYKALGAEATFTCAAPAGAIERLAEESSYENMERSIAALNKAADSLKQNANAKLTFAILMLEMKGELCSK